MSSQKRIASFPSYCLHFQIIPSFEICGLVLQFQRFSWLLEKFDVINDCETSLAQRSTRVYLNLFLEQRNPKFLCRDGSCFSEIFEQCIVALHFVNSYTGYCWVRNHLGLLNDEIPWGQRSCMCPSLRIMSCEMSLPSMKDWARKCCFIMQTPMKKSVDGRFLKLLNDLCS
jgi:hypothetical protein